MNLLRHCEVGTDVSSQWGCIYDNVPQLKDEKKSETTFLRKVQMIALTHLTAI